MCSTPSPPSRRYGHTMVAHNRHLYVFGGALGGSADPSLPSELHCFDLDGETWSVVPVSAESEAPTGRLFHATAVVASGMYVFGGKSEHSNHSGCMYRFQLSNYPKCTLSDDYLRLLTSRQFADVRFHLTHSRETSVHHKFYDSKSTLISGFSVTNTDKVSDRDSSLELAETFSKFDKVNMPTASEENHEHCSEGETNLVVTAVQNNSATTVVYAHAILVAARSLVLREMILAAKERLSESTSEHQTDLSSGDDEKFMEVYLDDAKPEAFRVLLTYIYTDRLVFGVAGWNKTEISPDTDDRHSISRVLLLMDVYRLALKLCLVGLENLCLRVLCQSITDQNVLSALTDSHHNTLGTIKEHCLRFIIKDQNWPTVINSVEFEKLDKCLIVEVIRLKQNRNSDASVTAAPSRPAVSSLRSDLLLCLLLINRNNNVYYMMNNIVKFRKFD